MNAGQKVVAILVVALLAGLGGCEVPRSRPELSAAPGWGLQPPRKVLDPSTPLLELEQEGLKVVWKQDLGQFAGGKSLKEAYVTGSLLIAESHDSSLFHLDALTGVWTATTSLKTPLIVPPVMGEKALFVLSGRNLLMIDPQSGLVRKRLPPWVPFTCQPVPYPGSLILGASSGEVCRYDLQTEQRIWRASAEAIVMAPPVLDAANVYAVGLRGSLIGVSASDGRLVWRWQPPRPSYLLSGLALADDRLYIGDNLGYVYCLLAQEGPLVLWKYPTGGPLLVTPLPFDGKLLVCPYKEEALCLTLGPKPQLLWRHPDAERAITVGKSSVYVLTRDRSVACIASDTGKEKWRLPLGRDCMVTSDPSRPIFYVYKRGGGIMAIGELK